MAYGNIVLGLEGPGNICLVSDKIIIDDGGRGAIRGKPIPAWKRTAEITNGYVRLKVTKVNASGAEGQIATFENYATLPTVGEAISCAGERNGGNEYYKYDGEYEPGQYEQVLFDWGSGHGWCAKIYDLKVVGFRNIGYYSDPTGPGTIETGIPGSGNDGVKKVTPVVSYKAVRISNDGNHIFTVREADVCSKLRFYGGGSFPFNSAFDRMYGASYGVNHGDQGTFYTLRYGEYEFGSGVVDLSDNKRYPDVDGVVLPVYYEKLVEVEGGENYYVAVAGGAGTTGNNQIYTACPSISGKIYYPGII